MHCVAMHIAASAGHAMVLSPSQLTVQKVLKSEAFGEVMDSHGYDITQSITSCKMCHPPGLFVRREWQDLHRYMDQIELGNASLFHDSDLDSHKLADFEYGCSRNVGLFLCLPSSSSPIAISALGLPIPPLLVLMPPHQLCFVLFLATNLDEQDTVVQ